MEMFGLGLGLGWRCSPGWGQGGHALYVGAGKQMTSRLGLGWRCLGWVWSWDGDVHQAGAGSGVGMEMFTRLELGLELGWRCSLARAWMETSSCLGSGWKCLPCWSWEGDIL